MAFIIKGIKGFDQVIKGVWRMPRHVKTMKDVVSCDKLRLGASNHYYPKISEWENLCKVILTSCYLNT